MAQAASQPSAIARAGLNTQRIALETLKGGVGKTELTSQMAAEDTRHGRRVLIVELDPQGSLTSRVLGVRARSLARTVGTVIQQVVAGTHPVDEARRTLLRVQDPRIPLEDHHRAAWGQLDILPCNHTCSGLRMGEEHLRVLNTIVAELIHAESYDRVWFDFSPSITILAQAGRFAVRRFVGVTEAARGSLLGIWDWRDTLSKITDDHPADIANEAKVVVNKYAYQEKEQQARAQELTNTLGLAQHGGLLVEPFMPRRAVVQQAEGVCLPVWAYGGPESHAAANLLSQIHARITKEHQP